MVKERRKRATDGFVSEYVNLPLAEGTKARIDGVLAQGESRVAFIRSAIDKELERRGSPTTLDAAE